MRIKLLLAAFLLLLFGSGAFGQGVRFTSQVSQQGTIATVANAVVLPAAPIISFCNAPASGSPCTNKATTYTDTTLGTSCSTSTQIVLDGTTSCVANPDSQNNWGVWLKPGQYAYTVTISGLNFGPYFVTAAIGTTAQNLNGVLYVGGPLGSSWGSAEIGAQIQAAYNSVTVSPTIMVLPQASGACYPWSGAVSFSTVGKSVNLIGVSPPNNLTGTTENGPCLNWTSSSGTGIVMDWTPSTGGGSPGGQISNITFWDNSCTTNGGCANSANAISVGPVNSGAMGATLSKIKFRGWGSGLIFPANASGLTFPLWINNFTFQQNTLAVNSAQSTEGWHLSIGLFIQNGSGWSQNAANTQIEFDGVHWDGNTGAAFTGSNCTGGIFTFIGNHFEATPGTTTHFVSCAGAGDLLFEGGFAIDDNGSSNTDFWFNAGSMTGNIKIDTAGETATNVFVSTMLCMDVYNGHPLLLTTVASGLNCQSTVKTGQNLATTLTASFVNMGVTTNASVFYIHDKTVGGSVIASVDNTGAGVALSGAVGAAPFVVGVPGANQVGLQYAAGFLQIEGNGARVGDSIVFTQIQVQ